MSHLYNNCSKSRRSSSDMLAWVDSMRKFLNSDGAFHIQPSFREDVTKGASSLEDPPTWPGSLGHWQCAAGDNLRLWQTNQHVRRIMTAISYLFVCQKSQSACNPYIVYIHPYSLLTPSSVVILGSLCPILRSSSGASGGVHGLKVNVPSISSLTDDVEMKLC